MIGEWEKRLLDELPKNLSGIHHFKIMKLIRGFRAGYLLTKEEYQLFKTIYFELNPEELKRSISETGIDVRLTVTIRCVAGGFERRNPETGIWEKVEF